MRSARSTRQAHSQPTRSAVALGWWHTRARARAHLEQVPAIAVASAARQRRQRRRHGSAHGKRRNAQLLHVCPVRATQVQHEHLKCARARGRARLCQRECRNVHARHARAPRHHGAKSAADRCSGTRCARRRQKNRMTTRSSAEADTWTRPPSHTRTCATHTHRHSFTAQNAPRPHHPQQQCSFHPHSPVQRDAAVVMLAEPEDGVRGKY